jgi:beta-glucosidase
MWSLLGKMLIYLAKWALLWSSFEGNDVSSKYHVASCMKHFIGYGSTTTGKDRTPSIIPERKTV